MGKGIATLQRGCADGVAAPQQRLDTLQGLGQKSKVFNRDPAIGSSAGASALDPDGPGAVATG